MSRRIVVSLGLLLSVIFSDAFAQGLTQSIRGQVIDKDSKVPLAGANVVLLDITPFNGTTSAADGTFRLEQVPLGRHSVRITYLGYKEVKISDLIINSAKELVIIIEMEENVYEAKEVVVTAEQQKDKPLNEMSTVSARSFTIEETNRYAGSWGDPSRMVSYFAGVTSGNDQRNDIVVRGNSPLGVLWRIEGMEVPSPNHFSTSGSSGGAISMLNNNTLENSDFMTGAFAAEYGNALSGVFDLRLRKGNNEKREYLAQVGAAGFELGAEGPFIKGKKSSYLLNYRYSAFGLMASLGFFDFVGSIPYYQDLSVKLFFPYSKGNFYVFGLGGRSDLTFEPGADTVEWKLDSYLMRKRYVESRTGIAGAGWMHFVSDRTYIKLGLVSTYANSVYYEDSTDYSLALHRLFLTDFSEGTHSASLTINTKVNSSNTVKAGVTASYLFFDFLTRLYYYQPVEWTHSWIDFDGSSSLVHGFAQWKHKLGDDLTLNTGAHYMHYMLNDRNSFEPRLGLRWEVTPRHAFSWGIGLHSKLLPSGVYFSRETLPDGSITNPNKNLDFVRALHYVIGYDQLLREDLRLKLEAYYQEIRSAPVLRDSASFFSGLNTGADYENITTTEPLASSGRGKNYGLEMTFEKFFSRGYYFLTTGSLYESKYTGSDNVERNTAFNSNYAFNFLGGKEFKVGKEKQNVLAFSFTWVTIGGNRVVPVDLEASRTTGFQVRDYSRAFEEKQRDYIRLDGRISFRQNRKKFSDEIALDVRNLLNRKNIFSSYYNERTGQLEHNYQMGIFPVVFYKIEF